MQYTTERSRTYGKILWYLLITCPVVNIFGYLFVGAEMLNGWYDEVISVLCWTTIPFWQVSTYEKPRAATLLATIFLLSCIGLFSAAYNPDLEGYAYFVPSLLTVFADLKSLSIALALSFFVFPRIARDTNAYDRALRFALWVFALLPTINVPFAIYDLFSSGYSIHGTSLMVRAGLYATQGVFSHKHMYGIALSVGIISATALWARERSKFLLVLLITYIPSVMATQDAKSIFSVLTFISGVSLFSFRKNKIVSIATSCIVVTLIIYTVWDSIEDQIGRFILADRGENIRTVVWSTSVELARRYFPLGSGAGTFGSAASFSGVYSPIYYLTGIASMDGAMIYGGGGYLMDFTWPKILAEYGLIGFASVLIAVIYYFGASIRILLRYGHRDPCAPIFIFGMACFFLCQSVAISILTVSYSIVPLALGFSLVISRGGSERKIASELAQTRRSLSASDWPAARG